MAISVACPECRAKLNAPDVAAGKRVKCPKCQALVAVPAAESPAFEVIDEPAAPATPSTPKKRLRPQVVAADDDEEEAPSRRRKKGKDASQAMLIRNIVGSVVLVILLCVAGYIYYTKFFAGQEDVQSASNTNTSTAEPPPGGFVKLEDVRQKMGNFPGAPGTVSPPGGPKGGGTKGGQPAPGKNHVVRTPAGFAVEFPSPPRLSGPLKKQLLESQGLTGEVYVWHSGASACTLLCADFPRFNPPQHNQEILSKIIEILIKPANDYVEEVSKAPETAGPHRFFKWMTKSPDGSTRIVAKAFDSANHMVILVAEYGAADPATHAVLEQFINQPRGPE